MPRVSHHIREEHKGVRTLFDEGREKGPDTFSFPTRSRTGTEKGTQLFYRHKGWVGEKELRPVFLEMPNNSFGWRMRV
jgi:hypothetical protein